MDSDPLVAKSYRIDGAQFHSLGGLQEQLGEYRRPYEIDPDLSSLEFSLYRLDPCLGLALGPAVVHHLRNRVEVVGVGLGQHDGVPLPIEIPVLGYAGTSPAYNRIIPAIDEGLLLKASHDGGGLLSAYLTYERFVHGFTSLASRYVLASHGIHTPAFLWSRII